MKQRSLILFLLLMSFSIGASGSTKNIIGCGTVTVSHDACDALKIDVKVKPDPGFTTCLDWITVTNQTTGGQYSISKSGNNAVDPAVTNPETYHYGSERTITLYVAKPDATDMSLPEPAADNVVITVCFKGGLKLQSNLANATVTWYDGGNAVPEADKAYPEITGASPYVSQFNTTDNTYATGDHYVIAHIVPGNDLSTGSYWTDASLLRSMEARSMETGISIAAGTRGIGTDSYRNLTLLKADEYDSGEGVMKPRHDGAGWYYYKIPKDNFFDTGYTTSVLEGDVVKKFDMTQGLQDDETKMITFSRDPLENDGWTAEISFTEASRSVKFDTETHTPVIESISIKQSGVERLRLTVDFNQQISVIGSKTINPSPMTLIAATNSMFLNADGDHFFDIYVPFATLTSSDPNDRKGNINMPWLITTPAELSMLAKCVNIGNYGFENDYILLQPSGSGDVLDMTGISDFEPIGLCSKTIEGGNPYTDHTTRFGGFFKGNGKTISNLSYKDAGTGTASQWGIGLFGTLWSGSIENVTLSGCSFIGSAKTPVIGGIAGDYGGDSNTISGCTIQDCTITGVGNDDYIGGIIAYIIDTEDVKLSLSNNRVRSTTAGKTAISGSATSSIGAILGNNSGGTLSNNKYDYNVQVTQGSSTASGYVKRGYWTGTTWDDITTNDGAVLWVQKATISETKPTGSTSSVAFSQVTKGTDCYDISGDDFYYAVNQPITLTLTLGTRNEDIRTFCDELKGLTVSDGTTTTDIIDVLGFTMPEADATIAVEIQESSGFTIPSNGKSWMSLFHEWTDANKAPVDYTVTAVTDNTGKSRTRAVTNPLELLTIKEGGIDLDAGTASTLDLGGISYNGVPTLLHQEGGLPEKLRFDPVTGKTAPQYDPQFIGGVSDLSAFAGQAVFVLFGSELVKADLSGSTAFDPNKAFVAASTKSATRLTLVRDGATAIDLVTTSDEGEGKWFDLQGRQLDGRRNDNEEQTL